MTENKKIPLIVIEGPTSAGKSDIAVRVAREIGGRIISADSMQVYRGMDIGTGKVTEEERAASRIIFLISPTRRTLLISQDSRTKLKKPFSRSMRTAAYRFCAEAPGFIFRPS